MSTNSRAGCFTASMALRISLVTPVAVSLWVASTALNSCFVPFVRISAYFSTGTPSARGREEEDLAVFALEGELVRPPKRS